MSGELDRAGVFRKAMPETKAPGVVELTHVPYLRVSA
jgi:hypothetical protein